MERAHTCATFSAAKVLHYRGKNMTKNHIPVTHRKIVYLGVSGDIICI